MGISEKVAYLKGLMEGMNLDADSNEGKLFLAIVDVLDEIALESRGPDRRGHGARRRPGRHQRRPRRCGRHRL